MDTEEPLQHSFIFVDPAQIKQESVHQVNGECKPENIKKEIQTDQESVPSSVCDSFKNVETTNERESDQGGSDNSLVATKNEPDNIVYELEGVKTECETSDEGVDSAVSEQSTHAKLAIGAKYISWLIMQGKDKLNAVHRCTLCNFTTKQTRALVVHVREKHDASFPIYRCIKCTFVTKYRKSLARHAKNKHDPVSREPTECVGATEDSSLVVDPVNIKPDIKRYKCTKCNYATKRKNGLESHERTKHQTNCKIHKCSQCSFSTKYRTSFKNHVTFKHNVNVPVIKHKPKSKFKFCV